MRLKIKHIKLLYLIVLSVFSVFLYISRVIYTDNWFFLFMLWNLFLAWIPFILSELIYAKFHRKFNFVAAILLFIWLLFIPNSLYIVTDLIHIWMRYGVPIWFNIIMIFSFAITGLFIGYASISKIQKYLNSIIKKRYLVWGIIILIFILSSFGIYLGRFERLNSWDVFANPLLIVDSLKDIVMDFGYFLRAMGVTIFYSVFYTLIYLPLRNSL